VELAQESDAPFQEVADAIMDYLTAASTAIDREQHVREFTDRAQSVVTEKLLARVCLRFPVARLFRGCAPFGGVLVGRVMVDHVLDL
jgi:hypothetical protein